ncbi:MAG TPA: glycosyltransferase family 1 protein [Chloroflexota bacterium]|nr:glycosyltransferase family 1 protein [Chloroflexota bacterium]
MAIDARLLAYQSAGTATYIRGLLRGFQEVGRIVDVVAVRSHKDKQPDDLDGISSRIAWTPCHHRWERWTFGLELATLHVDLLHSPDFIAPARLGRRWARVITVHDLAFLRFPQFLTSDSLQYYRQIHRSVAEAERIICVSEATKRDLLELTAASPEKIAVIPEGVGSAFVPLPAEQAARWVRERFGLDRPYFLFVGTLEPRKNLGRLVEAFARFRWRYGPNGPLLALVGKRGWLSDEFDAWLKPLGDSVRLLGRVDENDLVALYNGALVLALVSHYEGFGLPALEAMACGRATLVSNVASLPEIVGDAGLTVSPDDVEAISEAMARLWEDSELRAELGARGRRRAGLFNWPTVARETAAVYQQAVSCVC